MPRSDRPRCGCEQRSLSELTSRLRRVVAFDLDGTLVDSVADLARALNAALADAGLDAHAVDVVRGFVGNGARVLVERAVAAAHAGSGADVDFVLGRFTHHYESDLVGQTRVFDGVAEALDGLRGHALLAVATNKPGKFARPLVEALLPDRFAVVVGPDDSGFLKPDRRMLSHVSALTYADVVVFVGDSAVDVETAKNHGVPSVGVTWGLRPDEARGADVVVDQPRDLLPALLRLLSATA